MPSQQQSEAVTGRPFNPVNQPDIRRPYPTEPGAIPVSGDAATGGVVAPRQLADVRHIWDARPVDGYDFWLEDRFSAQPATPGTFAPVLGGYRVPTGFNLFLRNLAVSIWPNLDPAIYAGGGGTGTAVNNFMTLGGPLNVAFQLNAVPKMSVLVDGAATPYWTQIGQTPNGAALPGVPLFNPGLYDYEFDTFIPVPGGSLVTAAFTIELAADQIDAWIIMVQYRGNLIADTGRSLLQEAGNGEPLPVVIEG
jgi:hypothetical protein